ncbi:MAG: DUF4388 domain-containing protein [Planctomycetota bacterium]|jgi:outer membrane protein assembly factor BamB/tetratricopeptide (TPR) repeat protein
MTLKGDLDSISLADVFQTLSMTQQEGTLFVQDGESRKAIYFGPSGVSLITSGAKKGGKLGDMLVGLGKITPEQLEEALEVHKEADIRLGEAMIRLGVVTEKDIEGAVRNQIEEEIYDLFSWENATFEFVEGPPPEGTFSSDGNQVTELTFNVNSLIMEAARRIDEWDLIEKVIPSVREIFIVDAKKLNPLEYTDRERMILKYVDGRHSVREVVTRSHAPKFDVCKFLYRLIEQGKVQRADFETLLEFGDEKVRDENLEEAVKFYEQALSGKVKKKSDQFKARLRLAQAMEYLDRKKEAADEYKLLADAKIAEKDVEGAINIWQKVIDLNPLDLENKERLINVYLENRGHLDPGRSDVIRSIEYSLHKNGKSLAMAFAYAGQIDRAKEVLNRLIELVPSNVELRKALANIHLDAGEKAEAVEELQQIAHFLLANRDFDELVEVYKNIFKIDPSRGDIRKKISMIEAGEAIGPTAPRSGRKKIFILVAVVLLLLGAAGGAGYYQWMALEEWKRVEKEVVELWERSSGQEVSEELRADLRKKARAQVTEIPQKWPLTMLPSRVEVLLTKWKDLEDTEAENKRARLESEANTVAARADELERLYKGNKPLVMEEVLPLFDEALRKAKNNPYAADTLEKLKIYREKFVRLRTAAETLRAEADEAMGETSVKKYGYKQSYAKAWMKLNQLYTKGKRFIDLWESIRLPVRIVTVPPSKRGEPDVRVNGGDLREAPFTFMQKPNSTLLIQVNRIGYDRQEKTVQPFKLGRESLSEVKVKDACYHEFKLDIHFLADPLRIPKEEVVSDPVAAGGRLFVATYLGDVMVFGLQGKHIRKETSFSPSKHPISRGLSTRLFVSRKYIFFPCEDGRVYRVDRNPEGPLSETLFSYDTNTGEKTHHFRERSGGSLSEDEKILLVGTDRGVTAFDVEEGNVLWQHLLTKDDGAKAIPVCAKGLGIAGTEGGELLAFDLKTGPKDGQPLWKVESVGTPIRSSLAVYNGYLYAGTQNGLLLEVDLARAGHGVVKPGEGLTKRYIGREVPITCKPLYAGGFLFVTAGSIVYKLPPKGTGEIWQFDAGGRKGTVSPPTLFGDSIFVGNGDGMLYSLDYSKDKAAVRWMKMVQGAVKVRPAVDEDGTVWFLAEDGKGILIVPIRE